MTTHKLTHENKTGTLHLRIKPGVKELAQQLSEEEGRTLSNWIERVIIEKAREAKLINNGHVDRP